MKTLASVVCLLAALFVAGCGGGDTPEIISKEIAGNIRGMADILNSITDEASAKAAVPKIEALRANMRGVAARAKALPKMTESEMKAAEAVMSKDLAEVMQLIGPARMKLEEVMEKNPAVRKIIEPALTGMENDM